MVDNTAHGAEQAAHRLGEAGGLNQILGGSKKSAQHRCSDLADLRGQARDQLAVGQVGHRSLDAGYGDTQNLYGAACQTCDITDQPS